MLRQCVDVVNSIYDAAFMLQQHDIELAVACRYMVRNIAISTTNRNDPRQGYAIALKYPNEQFV